MKFGTYGPLPCRLQLSSKTLAASGMKPRDQVQLIAEEGQIIIKRIGEAEPVAWSTPKPKPSAREIQLDDLMQFAREKEARRRGEYPDEEDEMPLNEDQLGKEEL